MLYTIGMASRTLRRDLYADQTRTDLLAAATARFGEADYGSVSLDEICRTAQVTKGALYHHFKNKQAVFEAVFTGVCERSIERVFGAMARGGDAPGAQSGRTEGAGAGDDDRWQAAVFGLLAWLDVLEADPHARRILTEAPAILGWTRWRELETTVDVVRAVVADLVGAGVIREVPIDATAQVFFGAIVEGAMLIAHGDDPAAERRQVEAALLAMMDGLRRTR